MVTSESKVKSDKVKKYVVDGGWGAPAMKLSDSRSQTQNLSRCLIFRNNILGVICTFDSMLCKGTLKL